jgi:hypothetical protein
MLTRGTFSPKAEAPPVGTQALKRRGGNGRDRQCQTVSPEGSARPRQRQEAPARALGAPSWRCSPSLDQTAVCGRPGAPRGCDYGAHPRGGCSREGNRSDEERQADGSAAHKCGDGTGYPRALAQGIGRLSVAPFVRADESRCPFFGGSKMHDRGGQGLHTDPERVKWSDRAFEKERHVRKLVTIGVCAVILLGTASSCATCWTVNATDDRASIRAGPNTVGFGDRAGAPNYYCQPGVCQSTGRKDPDYRVCLGGYRNVLSTH